MSTRKNVSFTDPVFKRANEIIKRRDLNGMSNLIATLIHEEYERRIDVRDKASSKDSESVDRDAVKALKSWRADERRLKRKNKPKTP